MKNIGQENGEIPLLGTERRQAINNSRDKRLAQSRLKK